jgi:uncharacterized repeat protein (TIGR03803 family)
MVSAQVFRKSTFNRPVVFSRNLSSALLRALATLTLVLIAVTGASASSEKVIHSFLGGPDGNDPTAGVIFVNGHMYGTTRFGGKYLAGTVYELRPRRNSWKERVLYMFTGGSDGSLPEGGLVADASGNLYGTTLGGGSGCGGYGCGTVFELSANSKGGWTEHVLHKFTEGSDGFNPRVGLAWDKAGNLYGSSSNNVVFRLSPSKGRWTFTTIYTFSYGRGSLTPFLVDSNGNLFGASSAGPNSNDNGIVFELSPSSGGWTLTTLYTFTGIPNGYPIGPSPLVMDSEGNLYGSTGRNDSHDCYYQNVGCGMVYELTPDGGGWTFSTLYDFSASGDGSYPVGVIFDSQGNLYGTTEQSYHTNNFASGTLFKLTDSGGTWTESVLHNFTNTGDGHYPNGGLAWGADGHLYGTTVYGGAINHGAVFEFIP